MVVQHVPGDFPEVCRGGEHRVSPAGMHLDDLVLFVFERARLVQHRHGHEEFPQVVEESRPVDAGDVVFIHLQRCGETACQLGHVLGMSLGVVVVDLQNADHHGNELFLEG